MKVREIIRMIEADGWFTCGRRVITGSIITRGSPER